MIFDQFLTLILVQICDKAPRRGPTMSSAINYREPETKNEIKMTFYMSAKHDINPTTRTTGLARLDLTI